MKKIFKEALTSRNCSRVLDSCKVDIANVPFLIQAKNGYKVRRPKPEEIFAEMDTLLAKNFPQDSPLLGYPKLLIHKMDARKKYNYLVTMTYQDWYNLIEKVYGRQND